MSKLIMLWTTTAINGIIWQCFRFSDIIEIFTEVPLQLSPVRKQNQHLKLLNSSITLLQN